ncbi:MAG: molybdopterin-dependent oxidoreductase, partial [Gemmatimonadales bacterium]|nr:molybdopterin-dependent oxidoreductase [Gemmatimonadales bacterium]
MLIRRPDDIPASEITDERLYESRRQFVGRTGLALAATAAGGLLPRLAFARGAQDEPTPLKDVISYNNFYEFGTGKDDPAKHAHTLKARPWTVVVDGEVLRPRTFGVDELWRMFPPEERVYRLRCVEAWSMVIPWLGFPVRDLLNAVEPT